ncbi:hypothetical protein [Streptosporangium sandarakinum]|uniref:hypothetical protein n=1 Tax=Streptosporangium sandarakinum TaxID=1260955 RepID=UPI0037A4DA03
MSAALAPKPWYDLDWVEWSNIVGLVLTLVGLGLTWWQARGAANSAKAAQEAVGLTELQLRMNQLMILVPQLRGIINELDVASAEEGITHVQRCLDKWRSQASIIHGLLSNVDTHKDILVEIQQSIGLAKTASESIHQTKDTPIKAKTRKARTSMTSACDSLDVWLGKNMTKALVGGNEK